MLLKEVFKLKSFNGKIHFFFYFETRKFHFKFSLASSKDIKSKIEVRFCGNTNWQGKEKGQICKFPPNVVDDQNGVKRKIVFAKRIGKNVEIFSHFPRLARPPRGHE
jgi:hypothetical protein